MYCFQCSAFHSSGAVGRGTAAHGVKSSCTYRRVQAAFKAFHFLGRELSMYCSISDYDNF